MRDRRSGLIVVALAGALCAGAIVGAPHAASAAAPDDAATRLMQRIASPGGYGHAVVTVHALPKGMPPSVPLPKATLLGSVTHEQTVERNGNVHYAGQPFQLYYDVPGDRDAVVRAYEDALRTAGWKQSDFEKRMPFKQGGFTVATPSVELWCSPGDRPMLVNFSISPEDRTALDVSLSVGEQGAGIICSAGHDGFPFGDIPKSPLPTFTAANGVTIQHAGPAHDGTTTGARITSSLGLAPVFETFAKQLRDAGWSAGTAAGSADVRLQTFTKTVEGSKYVALLTLYALDATHFVALADVSR